jgi:hypothetical protein
MIERDAAQQQRESELYTTATKTWEGYLTYRDFFAQSLLYRASTPGEVDLSATEIMGALFMNPEVDQRRSIEQLATLSHVTMSRLRDFIDSPEAQDQGTLTSAFALHQSYGQIYAQALVEQAKLLR